MNTLSSIIPSSEKHRAIISIQHFVGALCLATFAASTANAFQSNTTTKPQNETRSSVKTDLQKPQPHEPLVITQTVDNKNETATTAAPHQRIISRFVNNETIVTTTSEAAEFQKTAESIFRSADYKQAVNAVEQAILNDPENGRLLLFAAQVFIANKDYTTAATYLDQATQILPQEDWYFVFKKARQFYNNDDFARHIDEVAEFSSNNAAALDAHLIRTFFAGLSGQRSAAKEQLRQIQNVWPISPFAQRLNKAFFDTNNSNNQAAQEN